MRKANIAKVVLTFVLSSALALGVAGCGSQTASSNSSTATTAKKGNFVIGFSNSYNGNGFRQDLETVFKQVADQLKQQGQISDYIITESNNDNETQASQIENLVLKHVSLIIIDPGSPTALNGAIAKAQAANIPVIVVSDGPVTSTYPYEVVTDMKSVTDKSLTWVINQMGDKGNLLILRGIPGSEYDNACYQEMQKVLKQYPDVKVVGQIWGKWTDSISQAATTAALPSLPKIDGMEGEGGEEYGAIQAFENAGRPVPIVGLQNRGNTIQWYLQQAKTNSNLPFYSICIDPSDAAASLYMAVDILNGKKVPQNVVYPNLEITKDNLSQYSDLQGDHVAHFAPTWDWVRSTLETQKSVSLAPWFAQ